MKLSIITINYNNSAGLKLTIESIINQSCKDFEYIIIDGGSNDGSADIIRRFEHFPIFWVSEKDSGIYNAMNKGIKMAKGKYLLFVNSGDYLINNEIISEIIPVLTGEDIIYGNLLINEKDKNWVKKYPEVLNFSYFFIDSLPHSGGAFLLKDAFKSELSFYDERLKIISDWKWFVIGIFKYQYTYKYIDKLIGVFDFSGISALPENRNLLASEKHAVMLDHFPAIYPEVFELLTYKNLMESRYIKMFLKLRKIIKNLR